MLCFAQNKLQFCLERCCQCGACLASCGNKAITRSWTDKGLFIIHWDEFKCIKCQLCVKVCPSHLLSVLQWTESDWESIRHAYLGCANDENIRYNATSGGIARTIIYTALKKQACSRVYTVCESNVYPWAMGAYLTIESDKANIANSIYRPLPVCENLIKITEGKLLVIGTSCQLLAMESFYASSQVQLIKVCIFCKQQKTLDFTRYLAKYLYISDYRNTPIKYRGSGWPGVITFGKQKVSFEKFASLPFGKRLWCIPACHYCTNPMGVKADLTLADPWGIIGKEQSGMTMVIIRTDEGEKLINMCKDQMQLREISLDLVKKSVDWIGIKRKQARTDYKRRKQKGTIRHILNTLGDVQRDIYEKLLLSIRLPKIVLKALNKLPYWG